MQRIARISIENMSSETEFLFSRYDELRTLLLRHLPPSTVGLFARPILKADNYVEWYSDLEGQPQLITEKSPQFEQANQLVTQRLQSIENLHHSLSSQGKIDATQSQLLQQLTSAAQQQSRQIYLVNNQPVLVGWEIKPTPFVPPIPPAPEPKSAIRWQLPLLLLLLLSVSAGFAWWWFNRTPHTVEPPFVEIAAQQKIEKVLVDSIPLPEFKPEPKVVPPPPKIEQAELPEPVKKEEPKKVEPKIAKKAEPKQEKPKVIEQPKKVEPPKPKTIDTALEVGKKWYGKYYCNGRMAKMTIEVIKRTGNRVVALERWDYGPGEVGIVYLEGVLTDKVFNARETRWHTRPQKRGDWYFTSFQGTYDAKRNIFHGRVPEAGCTTFEMRETK